MNNKGIALIASLLVIIVLTIFASILISRSVFEKNLSQRYASQTQAFWLAEAGANKATKELLVNFNAVNLTNTQLGAGGYSYSIDAINTTARIVNATGFVPFASPIASRKVQIIAEKTPSLAPPGFYDNALYAAGTVDVGANGNYKINGTVDCAGAFLTDTTTNPKMHVNGTVYENNLTIAPLYDLNYEELKQISQSQGNYFNASVSATSDLPTSFWYNQTAGIPNVIFIEGDLNIKSVSGKNKTIGGFYVTKGEVIYNETAIVDGSDYNASITGNIQIQGCIYAPGNFKGGGTMDIYGGIWVGNQTDFKGTMSLNYDATHMNAIKNLRADGSVNITQWRDMQNPYMNVTN